MLETDGRNPGVACPNCKEAPPTIRVIEKRGGNHTAYCATCDGFMKNLSSLELYEFEKINGLYGPEPEPEAQPHTGDELTCTRKDFFAMFALMGLIAARPPAVSQDDHRRLALHAHAIAEAMEATR